MRHCPLHTEEVMEKVLRRGIFVQTAHQIGNGAVEILGLDHRCIEQQTSGFVLDSPRLVVGHAFQHLELHCNLHAVLLPQQQAVGHVEKVMAGMPNCTTRACSGWLP